jgi:hypothetical protein
MHTEPVAVSDTAPLASGFLDRLGDRVQLTDRESGHVEILRLRPELTASPLFEPAVRRRAEQLAGFRHPNCANVRQIGRLPAPDGRLVIVSDAVDGWRLSEVLEAAGPCGVAFHADAVLFLLRQLLDAVAALHDVAPGVSHGALGTERLIVAADGRLMVTESVLGGALWHLPAMSPDRLWRDLRLAVADGEARPFGRRTDLRQIGIVALSLALGRQLRRVEYPTRLASLLEERAPSSSGPGAGAVGPAFRGWLLRVLSLTDELTPWSVAEARRELHRLVECDARYAFAPTGLPVVLGAVADYYAAAAEVPVPVRTSSRLAEPTPEPGPVLPPEPSSHSSRVEDQPAPGSDTSERPVSLLPIRSVPVVAVASEPVAPPSVPVVAAKSEPVAPPQVPVVAVAAERSGPPSLPVAAIVAAKHGPVAPAVLSGGAGDGPAAEVALLADTVAPEWPHTEAGGRRRHAHDPGDESSPRRFLGVDVAEDAYAPLPTPPGMRARTLIGIGAAAVVIVALGGYALVRPSLVSATATRLASSALSTAMVDAAGKATAAPGGSASQPDTLRALPAPQTAAVPPLPAATEQPAQAGAVEVVSPVSMNVSERGRPLGASGGPIQVSLGRHTLDIGREDLGYQTVKVVDVKPGRPLRIELPLPNGVANLNATPWAEVWIDGRKVGETPLGRVELTIGPHEVQFRHPELGDQTRTLVVTTGAVALLSVDLRK